MKTTAVSNQDPKGIVISPKCPVCLSGIDSQVMQDEYRDALLDGI